MAVTLNYKCPHCNAAMGFDPDSGRFLCHYCDSSFSNDELDSIVAASSNEGFGDEDSGATAHRASDVAEYNSSEFDSSRKIMPNIRSYSCPSCGASVVSDTNTAANRCVYCGNNNIIVENLQGMYSPDYVIPFALDKKAATEAYNKFIKKRKYLDKIFKSEAVIQEIMGVYVPNWLYSGAVDVDMSGNATIVSSHSNKDSTTTITKYYEFRRKGLLHFEKLPVDASAKMDDALMQSIEPYPYDKLLKFDMAYLSGFLADKFDENAADREGVADIKAAAAARSILDKSIRQYNRTTITDYRADVVHMDYEYAFLPVWLLSIRHKNKIHMVAVNGVTGKTDGYLPVSGSMVAAALLQFFCAGFGISFVIAFVAMLLLDIL